MPQDMPRQGASYPRALLDRIQRFQRGVFAPGAASRPAAVAPSRPSDRSCPRTEIAAGCPWCYFFCDWEALSCDPRHQYHR